MELYLKDFFSRLPLPYLQDDCKAYNSSGDEQEFMDNLSKINVFVGINNSGKSYLLRELAKADLEPIYYSKANIEAINLIIKTSKDELQLTLNKLNNISRNKLNSDDNLFISRDSRDSKDFKLEINLEEEYRFEDFTSSIGLRDISFATRYNDFKNLSYDISQSINALKLYHGNRVVYLQDMNTVPHSDSQVPYEIACEISEHLKKLCKNLSKFLYNKENEKVEQIPKIYLYPYRLLMENLYSVDKFDSQIKKQHFNDFSTSTEYSSENGIYTFGHSEYVKQLQLITGGRIPQELYRMRNSGYEDIQNIDDFEVFLSQNFLDNQILKIITKMHNSTNTSILERIHIKIGDSKDLPIYELGTGLQMMILLTLPLFMYDRGIIYIEEPELFIHPGMQKQLMDIYSNHPKAKDFQFFIATHSNHIIDSTVLNDDISIYTINKKVTDGKTKFEIKNRSHGDQDALQLLGVSNSSVYLVNCTIWVEGVTDKLYISAYIKAFLNHVKVNPNDGAISDFKTCLHYREGTHYGFVYSGGDNIIHWDFDPSITNQQLKDEPSVKYLCGEAFVIIDNDNEKNPSRKAKLKELLPDGQLEIINPEIENLLSLDVILQALIKYKTWKNFDIENIPNRTELESKLSSLKLGSFIDNNLKILKSVPSNAKAFSKDSESPNSTINDKVGYCRKAIECITYSNMTFESKELVKKILTFIIQKNQGIL